MSRLNLKSGRDRKREREKASRRFDSTPRLFILIKSKTKEKKGKEKKSENIYIKKRTKNNLYSLDDFSHFTFVA